MDSLFCASISICSVIVPSATPAFCCTALSPCNTGTVVGNSNAPCVANAGDNAVDAAKIVVERRPLLGRLAANAKGTSRAAASRGAAGAQQASWQGAAVAAATAAEILAPLLPPVGRGVLASDVLSLPLRDGASSIELGLAGKLLL